MSNTQAKNQIREGSRDKGKFSSLIENFQYGQQKQGLENPFANTTNPFANITNPFATQRVATQAAEAQGQRQDQSQANVLDAIIQGGGGAASTATAIAQQAAEGNQQIAAGLEGQEQQIQRDTAQGEQQRQQLVAGGEQQRQQLVGQGEQYIQGLSEQRDSSELAGLGNAYAGAQQTINSGYESIAANNAAWIGAAGQAVGAAAGLIVASDARLKENIEFQEFSKSGIPIYQFSYHGHPDAVYEGAMSAGVPDEAVVKNWRGTEFDGVDYSKIDVNLKRIK